MTLDRKFIRNSGNTPPVSDLKRQQKIPDFQESGTSRIAEYFDVLLNSGSVTDETIMTLEINGILLGNGCCCVLLAELDEAEISGGRGSDRFQAYEHLRDTLQYALHGTVVNYCHLTGSALVCLICFPRISEPSQLQDSPMGQIILQKSADTMSRFHADCGFSVNIYCSSFVKDIRSIHKAYQEARDMQRYAGFWGLRQSMLSALETAAPGQLMMDYPFFQQISDKLTNCLKLSRHEEISMLVEETVEYLRHATPHRFQVLITRILSFCNILFDKLLCSNLIDMKFLDANPFVADMLQISDEQGFRACLSRYLEQVERGVSRKNEISSLSRIQEAYEYIGANYADPSLSVASLAECFGMAQPTLTRRFQLVYGLSPSDCIHHIRVNQVKTLLETTNLTLSQIGEKTGYVSLSTMYRDFTKYEKISPGRYRLLHAPPS